MQKIVVDGGVIIKIGADKDLICSLQQRRVNLRRQENHPENFCNSFCAVKIKSNVPEVIMIEVGREKSCRCDCIGWAAERLLLAGAIPLLLRRASFWLLSFPPGPVRSSLDDLDAKDSSSAPMSTPGLVRTPAQHRRRSSSAPNLKPSTTTGLPVAGLQEHATLPADETTKIELFLSYKFVVESVGFVMQQGPKFVYLFILSQ